MGSSRLLGDQSVGGQVTTVSVSLVALHCEPKLESGQSSSTNNYDCLAVSDPDNLNPFRVRWGLIKRQVLLSFRVPKSTNGTGVQPSWVSLCPCPGLNPQ